jgi:PAS domain S-box-containing protein
MSEQIVREPNSDRQAPIITCDSQWNFRDFFERSADPILLLDRDVLMDCNEAALRAFRCTAKKRLIGIYPWDCSPERQPDGRLSSAKGKELIETTSLQGSNRFEWVHRTIDGEEFFVDVSQTAMPLETRKDSPVIYTVLQDVSGRKQAEEKLQRVEKRYRDMLENAVVGMLRSTPDGRFLSANPFLARIYGFESPEELMAAVTDIGDQLYVEPEARTHFMDVLERQGFIEGYESERYRKDGSRIWVSANVRAVRDSKGITLYYEGTVQDITERKKAEEALEANSHALQEINTALKVLLNQREADKRELEESVLENVKRLVLPYLKKLRETRLQETQNALLDVVEGNLNAIVSPFVKKIRVFNFTPKELEVVALIKEGKTTKDIASILHVSTAAVDLHRYNIRRKVGLNQLKKNLHSYLLGLE